MSEKVETRHGLVTGDIEKFTRLWFELDALSIDYSDSSDRKYKWYPYCKGGSFKRWYGNNEYVVNWFENGKEIRNFYSKNGQLKSSNYNLGYNFLENISWSDIRTANGMFSARYSPKGYLFDSSGPALFVNNKKDIPVMVGFLNSKPFQLFINITCNGLHFSPGSIGKVPLIYDFSFTPKIDQKVNIALYISKVDWDSFETSWDFAANPLVAIGEGKSLADSYEAYKAETNTRFAQLKANEEELNRIFIDIYGLSDELTPEVADKDVTVASIFDTKEDIPESYKGNNYVLTLSMPLLPRPLI